MWKSGHPKQNKKYRLNTYHNWSTQCLNHSLQKRDADIEGVHIVCAYVLKLVDILKLGFKNSITPTYNTEIILCVVEHVQDNLIISMSQLFTYKFLIFYR
jgi:hypothetical protein